MQTKAAPIREGVIVIKQETTMQELQQFATEMCIRDRDYVRPELSHLNESWVGAVSYTHLDEAICKAVTGCAG